MRLWKIASLAVAVGAIGLSLFNASWIAAAPGGRLQLVAEGGITHPAAAGAECGARLATAPDALYIENTLFAFQNASRFGADAFAIDVQSTADRRLVVFRDATLDCRTDGAGPVGMRTLADLKRLDVGYDYTADGQDYPLRGRGIGGMPTFEELLYAQHRTPLIVRFTDPDPAQAELVLAALAETEQVIDRLGFTGHPAVLAALKQRAPTAWTFDAASGADCLAAYRRTGWLGLVPESCRGATIALPLDVDFTLWGWPYRFLARMAAVDAKVVIHAGGGPGFTGLDRPEQLGEVPRAFRGHLWIADLQTVGRSLRR